MSATATPTRERILFASAELFRRQGYAGTGLKQVTGAAEATFGSVYHFFPGGKEQLAEEVLRAGGDFFLALYHSIVDDADTLTDGLREFFDGAGETLVATDYADACPIATVAGEIASTHEPLRAAASGIFALWTAALIDDLAAAGVSRRRARPLAVSLLALLEGAFLLCRTHRDVAPMHAARDAALALLALEIPTRRSS
jgi:AcrR family transcriptional regulator